VLPQVTAIDDAMKPGAPAVRDGGNVIPPGQPYSRGDVDAAFKSADVVIEHTFTTPFELHNPMELHGCVAKWDGNRLTVWESTQGVYAVQARIAEVLDLPMANVRVIGHYMGGGFGSKLDTYAFEYIAILLAYKTKKPVKMLFSREEEFFATSPRQPAIIDIAQGCTKDGRLTFGIFE
jgi:xanthine dehydrogenase YagR molybdenum-binding subunit